VTDTQPQHQPMRQQAAWVIVCRVIGILSTLAGNILAARLLGPAEYGRYLFLSSVVICGGMLGGIGLADTVLRFTAESLAVGHAQLAIAYVRRTAVVGMLTTLFAVLVTGTGLLVLEQITGQLEQPAVVIALVVVALSALSWQQLASETLRGWNNLKLASLFSGGITGGPISTLLFLVGIGSASLAGIELTAASALALFAGSVAITVPFAVTLVWRTVRSEARRSRQPAVRLSRLESRKMLGLAGTMLALALLGFVSEQLDIWIGRFLISPDELGTYGVAKRCLLLVAMPVQMAMLVTIGAIPRFFAQGRTRELQDLLRTATTLAAIPALSAMAVLVLFPGFALDLLFGDSYDAAAPLIRILAIGYMALALVGTPVNMLTLTGSHRTAFSINLTSALLMAVLGPLAASQFGAAGLAGATATALFVQCGLQWWLAHRMAGVWTHAGMPHRAVLGELPLVRRWFERSDQAAPRPAIAGEADAVELEKETLVDPELAGEVMDCDHEPAEACVRRGNATITSN